MTSRKLLRALALAFAILLAFPAVQADTYVVAVGINRYKHAGTLRVSEDDAKDFAALCKKYPGAHVSLITGRYATRARLQKAIRDRFAGTKADDTLIFYFSGHGNTGGCATFDAPEGATDEQLLSFAYIAKVMKQSPAKRKIIIADACFSGSSRSNSNGARTHRKTDPNVVLFMSSRANETSAEGRGMDNSVFTTYLLKGLKGAADANSDAKVTAREIFNYVSKNVRNVTNGRQHPVMWGNFDENFVILPR